MTVKFGCAVILVHGIGNQQKNWSNDFRENLKIKLNDSFERVKLDDAYWAPLSTVKELVHPSLAASLTDDGAAREAEIFDRTVKQVAQVLEASVPAAPQGFGPGDFQGRIRSVLGSAAEVVADIGNYVARNGVRTAVQNVVHFKLGQAELLKVPVLLISHSQGTVICYDVLRQAGVNYQHLRTWITMGSPLRKYYLSHLQWGRQPLGMPKKLRWVNLYDEKDPVGNDLKGVVSWKSPVPKDHIVDNVQYAKGGAHDHWHNAQVVKNIASEIRRLLASSATIIPASSRKR